VFLNRYYAQTNIRFLAKHQFSFAQLQKKITICQSCFRLEGCSLSRAWSIILAASHASWYRLQRAPSHPTPLLAALINQNQIDTALELEVKEKGPQKLP
jgi:hypothetical protein